MSAATDNQADAVTLQRQAQCKHSFVRGLADSEPRCPHCGVSQNDWLNRIQGVAAYAPWVAHTGGINAGDGSP